MNRMIVGCVCLASLLGGAVCGQSVLASYQSTGFEVGDTSFADIQQVESAVRRGLRANWINDWHAFPPSVLREECIARALIGTPDSYQPESNLIKLAHSLLAAGEPRASAMVWDGLVRAKKEGVNTLEGWAYVKARAFYLLWAEGGLSALEFLRSTASESDSAPNSLLYLEDLLVAQLGGEVSLPRSSVSYGGFSNLVRYPRFTFPGGEGDQAISNFLRMERNEEFGELDWLAKPWNGGRGEGVWRPDEFWLGGRCKLEAELRGLVSLAWSLHSEGGSIQDLIPEGAGPMRQVFLGLEFSVEHFSGPVGGRLGSVDGPISVGMLLGASLVVAECPSAISAQFLDTAVEGEGLLALLLLLGGAERLMWSPSEFERLRSSAGALSDSDGEKSLIRLRDSYFASFLHLAGDDERGEGLMYPSQFLVGTLE